MPRRGYYALLLTLFAFALLWTSAPRPVSAQQASPTPGGATPAGPGTVIPEIPTASPINITYPVHGIKVTGVINILGSIALEGWTSYEVAFAYANDQSNSWFNFGGGANPPAGGATLASWDTTTVSDGDYNIRLRVFSPGGSQDGFIYGLRVRNYTADTPVPTLTFTPTPTSADTPLPTFTPTQTLTPFPTPTLLPPNPATLDAGRIGVSFWLGALLVALAFGLVGTYVRWRGKGR